MRISDWSSDVCSSDLRDAILKAPCAHPHPFPNMVAAHRTRTEMQDAVRVVRKDLIDRHDRNVTSVAQRCTAASVGLHERHVARRRSPHATGLTDEVWRPSLHIFGDIFLSE